MKSNRRSLLALVGALGLLTGLSAPGCKTDGSSSGVVVPASSDPNGKDLVEGAIVVATEKSGGVRIYKIRKIRYFPDPIGEELVMVAYNEKGNDFHHAAALYHQGGLTIALTRVAVPRHRFARNRDYRILGKEPVTEAEKKMK